MRSRFAIILPPFKRRACPCGLATYGPPVESNNVLWYVPFRKPLIGLGSIAVPPNLEEASFNRIGVGDQFVDNVLRGVGVFRLVIRVGNIIVRGVQASLIPP